MELCRRGAPLHIFIGEPTNEDVWATIVLTRVHVPPALQPILDDLVFRSIDSGSCLENKEENPVLSSPRNNVVNMARTCDNGMRSRASRLPRVHITHYPRRGPFPSSHSPIKFD